MATVTTQAPGLELHFDINPEGEVDSYLPVRWTITEELVNKLLEKGYTSPHIVLVVSSITRYQGNSSLGFDYDTRKVYAKALTETPMQYVQFVSKGDNLVSAHIIDLADVDTRHALDSAKRRPGQLNLPITTLNQFEDQVAASTPKRIRVRRTGGYYEERHDKLRINNKYAQVITSAIQRVQVPSEFFAKEPPAWQQNIAGLFFDDVKGVDQCASWKKLIWGMVLFLPFQFYGLFARVGTLLYALFVGKRRLPLKELFALHPHEFARAIKYEPTFWFHEANGRERTARDFVQWISPLAILIYAAFAALATLVAYVVGILTTWAIRMVLGEPLRDPIAYVTLFSRGFIGLAVLITVIWLVRLTTKKGASQRRAIAGFIKSRLTHTKTVSELLEASQARENKLSRELRAVAALTANDIKPDTIELRVSQFKGTHCKPFSQ